MLAQLCEREALTYRRFSERFTEAGNRFYGRKSTNPTCGETQFRRWTAGRLTGLPSAETCQILEAMWPAYTAEQLFAPPPADDPQVPAFDLEEQVLMTARDAHESADATASATISDNTIDELRDRVTSLARRYHVLPPVTAWQEGNGLLREIERHRDRTQVPVQQQALMILNGQAAALLSVAAFDLGYFAPARTLARTAALFGESTRFTPLQAYADGTMAYIAYHSGEASEAVEKARRALSYGGLGDIAQRRLHAIAARAYVHIGDAESAQRSIRLSGDLDLLSRDELHDEVGGEFGFSEERLAMSNSTTALLMGDTARAEIEAGRALALLAQRAKSEQSTDVRAGAAADLAYARLYGGDVDGAAEALAPMWEVPTEQRNTGIVVRAARIGRHLAKPQYHGSALPGELRERIENFTRVSPPYQLGPGVPLLAIEA
ncbi:DNA-binding protein [Streptomyces diastatochromogenes]|nr:DNA-binding protein [Streptomyces diastatochromogenes]